MKVVIGSKYYFLDMGDIDLRDPTTVEDCAGSLRVRAFVPESRYGKKWHGQASVDRSDTEDATALALNELTEDRYLSSSELFTTPDECYNHWCHTLERRIECLQMMQEKMDHWDSNWCDPCETTCDVE